MTANHLRPVPAFPLSAPRDAAYALTTTQSDHALASVALYLLQHGSIDAPRFVEILDEARAVIA